AVHEAGVAGRELQAVRHQVQGDVVAAGAVVDVGIETVDADQLPRHLPQDGAPYEPDAVGLCDRAAVGAGVGVVVHREVGAVRRGPDAHPVDGGAHQIGANAARVGALVTGLHGEHQGEVVAPAFAHLLGVPQAVHVAGPAHQAVADAVAVLVHDHPVVQVAVPVRGGVCPAEHLHPRALPVGR